MQQSPNQIITHKRNSMVGSIHFARAAIYRIYYSEFADQELRDKVNQINNDLFDLLKILTKKWMMAVAVNRSLAIAAKALAASKKESVS